MNDPILHSLTITIDTVSRTTVDHRWRQYHPGPQEATRLYIIEAGAGQVWHHGQRVELRPGYMYIIPPGSDLRYHCETSMTVSFLHLQLRVLQGLDLFAYLPVHYERAVADLPVEVARVQRLIELQDAVGAAADMLRDGLVLQWLAAFARADAGPELQRRRREVLRLQPVLAYVDTHLGEPLRLADLAGRVHLEPTYFATLFARAVGTPPMRYVQQRRIDRARALLLAGETIADIAAALGFVDAFHFSRSFKKLVGLPPSAYRRHVRPDP